MQRFLPMLGTAMTVSLMWALPNTLVSNELARGAHHINGFESFWSFAKRRLQKFNGVSSQTFYLRLKECEWVLIVVQRPCMLSC
jgi:hypothetical protein